MEQPPAAVEVRKDEKTRLYEAVSDGRVVGTLAYETIGGQISLTHSYVDGAVRRQGVASALAHYALEDVGRSGMKARVYCEFVADYVQEHPELAHNVDVNRSSFIATHTARDIARS